MTELPRKLGIRAAYETCRRFVGPLVGLALAATGAQAGAWEEFQDRCLKPMENVLAPDVSDLPEPGPVTLGDLVWMPDLEGRQYELADRGVVMIVTDDPVTCIVLQTAPTDADAFDEAERWAQARREDQRYEDLAAIEMGKRNFNMGSTNWREPRLDIFGEARDEGRTAVFYVMETDLEA